MYEITIKIPKKRIGVVNKIKKLLKELYKDGEVEEVVYSAAGSMKEIGINLEVKEKPKEFNIDEKRVMQLYEKFGTLSRVALSCSSSPETVKKILIKNGVEIKKYKPKRFNINSRL